MRSFVYWPNMDIENTVKLCKGCALAAMAPPVKFNPWPETDLPWSRIHLHFAGPLEGYYYLIVVDSFSMWPEIRRCKNPMSEIVIKFPYKLFARFGIFYSIVTDNGSQFTSKDFKDFCEIYQIKHITTAPFYPRSNGQAKRFVDTFKRALKKASVIPTEKSLQQFLQFYRITPNMKTLASQSPAEGMFARRIQSVYDKLLPKQTKPATASIVPTKNKTKKKNTPQERKFTLKCSRITNHSGKQVRLRKG